MSVGAERVKNANLPVSPVPSERKTKQRNEFNDGSGEVIKKRNGTMMVDYTKCEECKLFEKKLLAVAENMERYSRSRVWPRLKQLLYITLLTVAMALFLLLYYREAVCRIISA